MTEIKAKGLDEARAALAALDEFTTARDEARDAAYRDYWTSKIDNADARDPDHLRHALTVADALAARLAEVEGQLERARAVGPRWVQDLHIYKLVIGSVEMARLAQWREAWLGYCDGRNGSYFDAPPLSRPTFPSAARAVCARLGLPEILDGLPDGGADV